LVGESPIGVNDGARGCGEAVIMADESSERTRIKQHSVPRHLLARFENDKGGLTVIRRTPEMKVLRRQAPESVGVENHLNNWRDTDGQWNDELERGPLQNLDTVGSTESNEAIRFGIEADAVSHLRLLNMELEQRARLQLFVASLMVRTVGFREQFDEGALPTLLAYMRARLDEQHEAGQIAEDIYETLLKAYTTPGQVRLERPEYRHLGLLVPLIEKVATRLHLDTYVGVRRFEKPLLMTGAEPVAVFPNADFSQGLSTGAFLASGDSPIEPWQEHHKLLEQIDARLGELAACAVALDPYTLVMMFHAETEDGGKLAYISSQVQAEGLAGLVNVLVAAGSPWIAGRDDCELLALIAQTVGG
jgi:Protein of unknown function (DUF4238)